KPSVAMPLVAAAFGDDGNLASGGLAVLCLVVRSQDFHFLDRICIEGHVGTAVVAGIDVGRTINGELMLVGAATIDAEGIDSASPRGMTVKRARDAWNK